MTVAQLHKLRETIPTYADRINITGIKLDMNVPAAVRAEQYLQQVKNPYAFRCGDVAVNIRFCREGKTLDQAIQSYLTALAGR